MAVGNRPLPTPNIDFGGFHNAASIEARAGAISAQLLNDGFARAQAAISAGIQGGKQRRHQLKLQEREFAERERGDLRQMSIAQMRQNAVNARAMIDIKKEEARRIEGRIAEYQMGQMEPPADLVQRLNQLTQEMGQLAAGGAQSLAQAGLAEHVTGRAQGSVAPGGFGWNTLAPHTYGPGQGPSQTRKASTPQAGP